METSEKQNWSEVLLKFKDDLFLNSKEPEGKLGKLNILTFIMSTLSYIF